MEQIRLLYRLMTVTCLLCLGFSVGMCLESSSDPLIRTYVSSSLPSNDYLSNSIEEISESDWDSLVIQSKIPVMVLFKTDECVNCRLALNEMETLDLQFKDRFKFYVIDVNKETGLQERYQANTIPTTIVFLDGEDVNREIGYQPERLRELVLQYMS